MITSKLQSFSRKITKGVLYVSLANLVFVVLVVVLVRPAFIETMSRGYITYLGEYVKDDIRYTLLVQDNVTTKEYLDSISKFPWIRGLNLFDRNGVLLHSLGESNWYPERSDFNTIKDIKSVGVFTHRLETVYTTDGGGEDMVAGLLHISIDGSDLIEQVDHVLYLIVSGLILCSVILWFLMRSFAISSTGSIRELNASINKIEPDSPIIKPIDIVPDFVEVANVQSGVNSLIDRITTNRNELESRVRERTIDLANAMESNSRSEAVRRSLIMNLSHDLKTPLSSNIMYLDHAIELIEEGESTRESVLPMLVKSRTSSMLLRDEIKTLLQYSTATDNSESIVLSEFSITEAVSKSFESTVELCNASNNRIEHTHIGRDNYCSSSRLFTYILDNLITNAHKACKQGEVSVSTEIDSENYLTLVVHDNGMGIPEDERENIFEQHFQVNQPVHVGPRGMGIGLSLVRFWIDQLGGTIDVDSEEGEYTEFTIKIYENTVDTSAGLPVH